MEISFFVFLYTSHIKTRKLYSHLVAPAADCRVINPEIRDIEPYDPFLTYPYIQEVAGLWAKGLDRSDPMVTPLLADFTPLKERGVVVDGIYGTWDLLAPDDRLLAEKLRDDGLEGSWMAYEGQIHCFPLTW